MDVTGRDHFKSTRLYADVMWHLLTEADKGFEAWYLSYSKDLSSYHCAKIKEMVRRNPYYFDYVDLKGQSEGVISYSCNDGPKMTLNPSGLLTFKRGIHADHIYVDDPLKDPENKLLPTVILKINRVMKAEVMSMVKKGGTCRIVGTPQTPEDFFFDEELQKHFKAWITPAIVDEKNQVALWPEWHSFDDLIRLRSMLGEKIFAQEYMASPVYSEDSYIPKDKLLLCVTGNRSGRRFEPQPDLANKLVEAGFDVGQRVHPSHFSVMIKRPDPDGGAFYEQAFQAFLDGWDYTRQIEYLNQAIDYFNISVLRYDNTRGEFIFAEEQGLMKPQNVWKPITFNARNQASLAAHFGTVVERMKVSFLNDQRQLSQILAVDNQLNAVSGPEGHGDSFWSNALAMAEETNKQPNIRFL